MSCAVCIEMKRDRNNKMVDFARIALKVDIHTHKQAKQLHTLCDDHTAEVTALVLVGQCEGRITSNCRIIGEPEHPCPFQEDVNNDSTTLCNCCSACAGECAMDI